MSDNKGYLEIFQDYLIEKSPSDNSPSTAQKSETSPSVELYRETMSEISKGDISSLKKYIDTLFLILKKNPKLKAKIKSVLVSDESLQAFKTARKAITDLHPLLVRINKEYNFDNYYELSLKPEPYIYGSVVVDRNGNPIAREPRTNEEIESMLELFINVKDYDDLEDWIFAILLFMPDQVIEEYKDNYCPLREDLRSWTWGQVFNSEKYRIVVVDKLFKKKELRNLFNGLLEMERLRKRHTTSIEENRSLKGRVRDLEDQLVQGKAEYHSTIQKQNEKITDLNRQVEILNTEVRNYNLCKKQLSDCIERYNAQIGINERVVIENDKRISEIQEENKEITKENQSLEAALKELRQKTASLESDLSLKASEVKRLRDESEKKESAARHSLLCELVTGINDQLFYLTCFYLDLKETGHLEPETVGLFEDTLNSIDSCLSDLGVQKIGVIDQQIKYDSSLYSSSDGAVANGETVKVCGYGWKIENEIYMKAPVEKGNNQ